MALFERIENFKNKLRGANLGDLVKKHIKEHGSPLTFASNPLLWLGQKISGAISSVSGKYLGTNLTGAEREANAFTQQQNQEAMAFEERMADKQMAFQADQAATQWQRGVSDMQAAGLNPALAYGQGGAQAMSGASGSGHAGASVTPGVGSLSDLIQLATLKPTIENMKAEARNRNAEARIKEIDASTRGKMNETTIYEMETRISNLLENTKLTRFQRSVLGPLEAAIKMIEKDKVDYETTSAFVKSLKDAWDKEFYDKNGYWPGDNAQNAFFRWIQGMINDPWKNAPFHLETGEGVNFPLN